MTVFGHLKNELFALTVYVCLESESLTLGFYLDSLGLRLESESLALGIYLGYGQVVFCLLSSPFLGHRLGNVFQLKIGLSNFVKFHDEVGHAAELHLGGQDAFLTRLARDGIGSDLTMPQRLYMAVLGRAELHVRAVAVGFPVLGQSRIEVFRSPSAIDRSDFSFHTGLMPRNAQDVEVRRAPVQTSCRTRFHDDGRGVDPQNIGFRSRERGGCRPRLDDLSAHAHDLLQRRPLLSRNGCQRLLRSTVAVHLVYQVDVTSEVADHERRGLSSHLSSRLSWKQKGEVERDCEGDNIDGLPPATLKLEFKSA